MIVHLLTLGGGEEATDNSAPDISATTKADFAYATMSLKCAGVISVTRFGENSPLWTIFGMVYFLANITTSTYYDGTNFHCCKWPKIE